MDITLDEDDIQAEDSEIAVYGARVHNLKNIDVTIPKEAMTVITGLSGSGKSSLAFDTIYAEGQRRYIETFSSYARNMLGTLERPDVDKITGLSPVISIEQKTVNKNPRSTVGTTTEIYDFLRLLYAKSAIAYSYSSGEKMVKYTAEKIQQLILDKYKDKRIYVLAPLVRNRKGHYQELFAQQLSRGFLYIRVDGKIRELTMGMRVDRYKLHDIELVIDRIKVNGAESERLRQTTEKAFKYGEGTLAIVDYDTNQISYYSKNLMDPVSGVSYRDPAPHDFSFNSPQGACPCCRGYGVVQRLDRDKVMPNPKLSIYKGGIVLIGKYFKTMIFSVLADICKKHKCDLKTPIKDLPKEALDEIFDGIKDDAQYVYSTALTYEWRGLLHYLQDDAIYYDDLDCDMGDYSEEVVCPECGGERLNQIALSYRLDGKNIAQVSRMDISQLYEWICQLPDKLDHTQSVIATEIIKEIRSRVQFLLNVGLDYLSLNRASSTLSGGESQRIRLATQIGSQLVNVLYILDEPSIGLHQRDNMKLIDSLKTLRNEGNTIIVVEHDKDMMLEADYIVDIGPKAGRNGGEVVYSGTPKEMLLTDTMTAQYLSGVRSIVIPKERRKGNGKLLSLRGCTGNNLKDVDIDLPLGTFICVSGVSGSGKSSLINGTLQPILSRYFYRSLALPLPYREIKGISNIDKIITVDQSPLGRTPRSNPATYTGVFTDIRNLFVASPEAKIRGYKPGRFSFNVSGGRCEACKGNGYKTIEMNFLPDVLVPCEVCGTRRYNRETLEVRYKGKSIADVLDMTVNQAVDFFENIPPILRKIKTIQDVGLGYIKLGQPSTTLSGGESQRVKLATELSKRDTGKTLFLLDEPTTGLHFDDINILIGVLNRLVEKGNTVIVIEHNLDVIKCADYIIDMGPDGGRNGGQVMAVGTPEDVVRKGVGATAPFLKKELGL